MEINKAQNAVITAPIPPITYPTMLFATSKEITMYIKCVQEFYLQIKSNRSQRQPIGWMDGWMDMDATCKYVVNKLITFTCFFSRRAF